MSAYKSYERDPTLNVNGIRVPYFNKGPIPPSTPKSPHHVANDGGHIRLIKGQTGWRIRCAQVGSCGGFDISIGNGMGKSILPGMVGQVDFTVDIAEHVKIEHIGMLIRDWSALVITRLF